MLRLLSDTLWGKNVLVTLVMLALVRIKRPEQLRQHQAQGLGRVLGLDRAPEVKTLFCVSSEFNEGLVAALRSPGSIRPLTSRGFFATFPAFLARQAWPGRSVTGASI